LRYLLWNGHHEEAREAMGRIASGAEDATLLNGGAVEAKARRLSHVARSCPAKSRTMRAR
jgi:hypothetical protein